MGTSTLNAHRRSRTKYKAHSPRHIRKFAAKMWTAIKYLQQKIKHKKRAYDFLNIYLIKELVDTYNSSCVIHKIIIFFLLCCVKNLLHDQTPQAADEREPRGKCK